MSSNRSADGAGQRTGARPETRQRPTGLLPRRNRGRGTLPFRTERNASSPTRGVHKGEVGPASFGEQGRILRLELRSGAGACDVKLGDPHLAGGAFVLLTNDFPLVWSPHGRLLATASWDNRVVLWDTRTRKVIREPLRGHRMGVYAVAFSPDGRRLATGGIYREDAVKLWNVETGAELVTLPAPTVCIQVLAFSPDGNTLAGISTVVPESWLYLWHVPSWPEIAVAEQDQATLRIVR